MEEMEGLQKSVLDIVFFCITVGIGLFAVVNLGDVFNRSPIISVLNETHTISATPDSFYLNNTAERTPKIVSGSEVVVMGGATLIKDVDYTIDYNTGMVTIL